MSHAIIGVIFMDAASFRGALTRKLVLIYALNVADWFCTVVLLRAGGFYEANPLMRLVIDDIPLGFAVKGILPLSVIFLVMRMMRGLDAGDLRRVGCAAAFVLTVYAALCLGHIVNFAILYTR